MRYFRRAWSDTFNFLGGWGLFFSVVAVPLVGFGFHAYFRGMPEMMPEFEIWLIYGLAATGAVFLSLFCWNFACAPYRMERDAHRHTQAERDLLAEKVQPIGRRLTPSQKAKIADLVRGRFKPDETFFVPCFQNEECLDFGQDFIDAFRMAGAESRVPNLLGGPISSAPRDVHIQVLAKSDDALVQEFSELLTEFGIKHEIQDQRGSDMKEPFRLVINRPS